MSYHNIEIYSQIVVSLSFGDNRFWHHLYHPLTLLDYHARSTLMREATA